MAMILESIIKEPLKSNIAQRRSTIFNFYAIIIFLAFGADVYWIFWGPTAPGPYYLEVWIVISFFLFVAKQDALSVLSFAVGAVGLNVLLNTPLVGSPSLGENPVVYLCIASMFIAGTVLTTRAVDWIGGITIMSMIIAGTYLPPTHSQEWVENYWTITLLAVFMWRTSRASGISIETLFTQTQVQQEKIVEITKKKLAYINKISHELRSPLHTISGYSSRLLTGKETELENDLQVIKDTSTHASSIVDGVLDLARLESGQIEAVATRFNIIEMIETLVEIGECSTENNPPNYNFYTSSGFPAWIVADKVRTRQIISNLVNNAVKHSNCHNITIRLTHTKSLGIGFCSG